ncbi:MAG: dimethylarginine dimethylaminohydrolase, partial [Pseudomonadota bacterium]
MSDKSYRFSHAITRSIAHSAVTGLRAVDTGAPDLALFRQHHADYVAALRSTGADVTVLSALEDFPDSCFVEDSALCLREGAIAMRPGAPSRLGEAAAMKPTLEAAYSEVRNIETGFIEGGDVLLTEREILVGR